MCRDEVGLTSWLGRPLHRPARLEQARALRHPLEFRKLPCIRGCRLTGLVASSGCRPERGMKPLRERKGKGRGRVGVRGRRWRGLRFARNLDPSLKRWEDQGGEKVRILAQAPTIGGLWWRLMVRGEAGRSDRRDKCLSHEPSAMRAYPMQLNGRRPTSSERTLERNL